MSSSLLKRRALLQAKLDEYEDCVFGAVIANNSAKYIPFGMTGYVEIPSNCTQIYLKCGNSSMYNVKHLLYKADKSVKGTEQITNGSSTLTISLTAGSAAYIRMNFDIDAIDDCYIKDNTNNQYLWKGKNV